MMFGRVAVSSCPQDDGTVREVVVVPRMMEHSGRGG